jgi:Xaa-Pro aminopeptidase
MNKYGSRLLKLPVPKLVVFYNGKAEQPDEMILHLSDSFPAGSDPDIAVRVRMINVNFGRNRKLMEDCKPLAEYAWLVSRVRKAKNEEELEHVIDAAITEMPSDYVIKAFLEEHRAEVKGMLLTEYDEVATMELFREEGRAEGTLKTLVALVKNGLLSPENAAKQADMTLAEFEKQTALFPS